MNFFKTCSQLDVKTETFLLKSINVILSLLHEIPWDGIFNLNETIIENYRL